MKKKEYQKMLEKEKRERKEYKESNAGMNGKTLIIITIGVILFIFLMFAFTKIKTGEWNLFTKQNSVTYRAEVQDVKILCGSLLNRTEEEYYVLAYEIQNDNSTLYETIIERYNSASSSIKLYKLDLSNSRNNICKGDLNLTNDVTTLKLNAPTLIKVKNGTIVENYTDYNQIKNILLSYVD
ncbi:MAG: hypothetical protein IJ068_03725 [Bacilli bacterium]|nr:hypothetical protein [Bacilli bacterium]